MKGNIVFSIFMVIPLFVTLNAHHAMFIYNVKMILLFIFLTFLLIINNCLTDTVCEKKNCNFQSILLNDLKV